MRPLCLTVLGPALIAATGCHGVFLGEDFQAKALPQRPVNAWPLIEKELDPATGETRTLGLASFIYYHDEPAADASQAAAFPFFWRERTAEGAKTRVPPFFWRTREGDRSSTTAWPLFGSYRDREGHHRLSVMSELVSVERDEREDTRDVSAPRGLVEYHREGDHTDLSVLGYRRVALFSRHDDGEDEWTHLFPLFWQWSSPGPEGGEGEGGWMVPPLAFSSNDAAGSLTIAGPLYLGWSDEAEGTSRTIVPPLLLHAASDEQAGTERLDVLYPLFHAHTEGPNERHWSVLFHLVRNEVADADTSDFRVLYKLFRHREDGARSETALAPFFTVSEDEEREWFSLSVLWPLFAYERDGERSEVRFFHFLRIGS